MRQIKLNFIKVLATLSVLFSVIIVEAQTLNWVSKSGSFSGDIGQCINVDSTGNVYTLSIFQGSSDFDPGVGVTTLTSLGANDIAIQKFDKNGVLIWAKSIGSSGAEKAGELVIDQNGDFYLIGDFSNTVNVDLSGGVRNLVSSGSTDIMIMKYDANAGLIWSKSLGSTSADGVTGISIDASGTTDSLVLTGTFNGTVDFDPGAGVNNLTSVTNKDIFVLKLDDLGDFVWAKSIKGVSNKESKRIAVDTLGDIYLGGNFQGTVDLDPDTGINNVTSAGSWDFFTMKLDATGNFVWGYGNGGTNVDKLLGLTADASGNVYATGFFQGSNVDLDPTAGTSTYTSLGGSDCFVQKLDATGNFVWANVMGGTGEDKGNHIALDASGDVYTAGFFGSTCDFDPSAATFNKMSNGGDDIFYQKMDAAGKFEWVYSAGAFSADKANYIAIDANKLVHVTGYFQSTVDFNPTGTTTLSSSGSYDIFRLQLDPCIITTSAIADVFCDTYTSPSGNYTWTTAGPHNDALTNAAGCDSIITVTLSSLATTSIISDVFCDTYTSPSGNYTWTTAGLYKDTLTNVAGCDSFMTVVITSLATTSIISDMFCDTYTSPSGNYTWTTTGLHKDTLTNVAGCDSFITVSLTSLANIGSITDVICSGTYQSPSGNYTWTQSGTYLDTMPNVAGCDSIITINLTFSNNSSSTMNPIVCNNYTPPSGNYTWTQSGTYLDTIPNVAGCDSIITINLTINNHSSSNINQTSCYSFMSPSGNYFWTQSGIYSDTISNTSGCDSVIAIDLTITDSSSSSINQISCDSYISPSGNYIWTQNGIYSDTISNASGCDSVIAIDLTITNSSSSSINQISCDSYISPSGEHVWTLSGIYNDTLINTIGCDSVITIDLTITTLGTWPCDTSTGIIENDFGAQLTAYPNPTTGKLSIDLGKTYTGVEITVSSLVGKVIQNQHFETSKLVNFEIKGATGLYLVEVITEDGNSVVLKVLKE